MFSFVRSVALVALVVIIVGSALSWVNFLQSKLFLDKSKTDEWQIYKSHAFNFEIAVPPNWIVVEFPNDEIAPRVNIYPEHYKQSLTYEKNGIEHTEPITHHSEVPNVSIFPHGVPTEGFFGDTDRSDVTFSEEVFYAHDFILKDGTHFATFALFSHVPNGWGEAGFVWARASVGRWHAECFRGELKIKDTQCDPLAGDSVVHSGRLKEKERDMEKTILASFKFIP